MCVEIPISELIPNEPAWVRTKYDSIFDSVQDEGILEPIEVWECDGEKLVVHGHHRVMIYKDLGKRAVPCKPGCPGNQDMAKWTIKKRIANSNKGFENFPQVPYVESRDNLNIEEDREFKAAMFWREA